MYMDALESEVESLSAEVTRLRLMLHRVTQVMDVPLTVDLGPDGAVRSAHADPMTATLGTEQWAPTRTASGNTAAGEPAPPLSALAQILRAYPVELLELLAQGAAGQNDSRRSTKGKHRRHSSSRRRRSSPTSSSSSSSTSVSSSESSSASSQPENVSGRKMRTSNQALPRGSAMRKDKGHGTFAGSRAAPPAAAATISTRGQQMREQGYRRHSRQYRPHHHHSRSSSSSKDVVGLPTALRNARRATIAKAPSEGAGSQRSCSASVEVASRVGGSGQENANEASLSMPRDQSYQPRHIGAAALEKEPKGDIEAAAVATLRSTSIGQSIVSALRQQEAAVQDNNKSDSSSLLPPMRSSRAAAAATKNSGFGDKSQQKQITDANGIKVRAHIPDSGADEDTGADMSHMSMSAINDMLRFHSTSPAEVPLGKSASSIMEKLAGAAAAQQPTHDKTLLSVGEEGSYFDYSAFNFPMEASQSVPEPKGRKSSDGMHARVVSRSSENSGIDRQHYRSHAAVSSSPRPASERGAERTPVGESWHSPSDARYSFSAFGSVAASGHSLVNPAYQSAASEFLAHSKPSAVPSAMRPISSEGSTTEDASGLQMSKLRLSHAAAAVAKAAADCRHSEEASGDGELVFGARKPIPVSGGAAATSSSGMAPAATTPARAALSAGPSVVGVRTPSARRTLLQCIRDQAENSSDDDDDDDESHSSGQRMPARAMPGNRDDSDIGSAHQSLEPQPMRHVDNVAEDTSTATDTSEKVRAASYRSSQQRQRQQLHQQASEHPELSPANRSVSYAAGDLYSLGMYTPQQSPRPSQSLDANFFSQQRQSQHGFPAVGGSASISGAYDYDFGFNSLQASARPSARGSPGSPALGLPWMRSRSEDRRGSVDTRQLMEDGGYMFD